MGDFSEVLERLERYKISEKTKGPEGPCVVLAGQKVCQHKLSSPQERDFICTSYQPQRFQFSRAGFPALTPSITRLPLALWTPRPDRA